MDNQVFAPALVGAGSAFLLNLVITPILVHISHKNEWYDETNHRKVHTGKIPRIGGVGIFGSFVLVCLGFLASMSPARPAAMYATFIQVLPFLLAFGIIFVVGLVDDFADLRARVKLVFEAIAALIVTIFGHPFLNVYIPFADAIVPLGPLSYIITFLWVIGLCNAVNLLDGLDGLAGGTSLIATLSLGVVFGLQHNYTTALFAFFLAGAIGAFLVFNLPPARLFMGDSGALSIGFILASLPLIDPNRPSPGLPILVSVTILLVPILDTLAAIARRIRRHTPIHAPDREHIHHKLLDIGVPHWGILATFYGISALLGVSAVMWVLNPVDNMFLLVLGAWLLAVGFIFVLNVLHRKRRSIVKERVENPAT